MEITRKEDINLYFGQSFEELSHFFFFFSISFESRQSIVSLSFSMHYSVSNCKMMSVFCNEKLRIVVHSNTHTNVIL